MSNNERKIYDLVVRRFISVLYPAFEYEQTTLKAEAADETFTAKRKGHQKPPDGRPYMPMLHLPVPLLHSMMLTEDYEDSEDFGEDFQNNDMYLKASEQALPVLHKGDTPDCHTHEYHKR